MSQDGPFNPLHQTKVLPPPTREEIERNQRINMAVQVLEAEADKAVLAGALEACQRRIAELEAALAVALSGTVEPTREMAE